LGGGGMSIIKGSQNPSFAFGFLSHVVSGDSNYIDKFANIMGTLSPYAPDDTVFPVASQQISQSFPPPLIGNRLQSTFHTLFQIAFFLSQPLQIFRKLRPFLFMLCQNFCQFLQLQIPLLRFPFPKNC
jgi:hypothetical protein